MPYQNISAELTAANLSAIKQLAQDARNLMPFLQTLQASDRVGLYKMGPKRLAWVEECLKAARNHPEILPTYFKLVEFEKDFALARELADIRSVFGSLFTDLNDTTMGVGSEAATAASSVMGYIDDAAKNQPGLRSVAETLHTFFKQANDTKNTPATP